MRKQEWHLCWFFCAHPVICTAANVRDMAQPEGGEPYAGFQIDTHLNNGGESEFLNYGGYMDTGARD
ncbi:MAG: hypothetical protein IJI08_09520, partial [Clostridia bacterium]|nr:hypothetical protein [Clostridia bacterium]